MVAEHARANGVDGAAMLGATSDDAIGALLGQSIFGRKRKLQLLLKEAAPELKEAAPKLSSEPSSGAAAVALAPPSSSSATSGAAFSSSSAGVAAAPSVDLSSADGELDCDVCQTQLQDECYALGLVKWRGTTLDSTLNKNRSWASHEVRKPKLNQTPSPPPVTRHEN